MPRHFVLFTALTLLMLAGCESHDHKKVVKNYKLAPGAKKQVFFDADKETRINLTLDAKSDERSSCQKGCISAWFLDTKGRGERITFNMNSSLMVPPVKGKVRFWVQNQERFPLKVIASWTEHNKPTTKSK